MEEISGEIKESQDSHGGTCAYEAPEINTIPQQTSDTHTDLLALNGNK